MDAHEGLKVSEVVLPSGVFASIRKPLAIDLLLSIKMEHPEAALMSRLTLFDGESKTYDEILMMPIEEFIPVRNATMVVFEASLKLLKGKL